MNATEIQEIVTEARTNHGFIAITRYRSNSGRISNVTLQPLGPDGYHSLIQKSLDQVEAGNVEKPNGVEQTDWDKAIIQQCASWKKTLDGGHDRKSQFTPQNKAFYAHPDNDAVTVRNVVIIRKDIIVEGDHPSPKSRPLTIAKKLLVGQTPVFRYQGSYKLDPSKFDRIKFNGNLIEGDSE